MVVAIWLVASPDCSEAVASCAGGGGDGVGAFGHLADDILQTAHHFGEGSSQFIFVGFGRDGDGQVVVGDGGGGFAHALHVVDQLIEGLANVADLILAHAHLVFFLVAHIAHQVANGERLCHFCHHAQRGGNAARNQDAKPNGQ